MEEYHFIFDGKEFCHSGFDLNWVKHYFNYDPKVFIEFGSYDGGESIRFLQEYPECHIYAIEADPELYNHIKQLERYGIKTFHYAICDINGEVDFLECKYTQVTNNYPIGHAGGSGTLMEPTEFNIKEIRHQKYENRIKVPAITIEKFCDEQNIKKVDIMHIDVEGATMQVLNGFGNIRPKMLFIEVDAALPFFKNCPTFDDVNYKLKQMNYELILRNQADSLFLLKD